jgi:hypothetical protein
MTAPALLTTADTARALGISRRRVQELASKRGLGQRLGRTLILDAGDLDNLRVRQPRGRRWPAKVASE